VTNNGKATKPKAATFDIQPARQLFGLIFDPGDWITIRPIESWTTAERRHSRVDYQNVTTLRQKDMWDLLPVLVADASERHSCIFYGVCPRFGGCGSHEEKWAIRTVRTLWCDVDDLRPAGVAERCTSSGVPLPTATIDSGRGVHLYWVLDELYLINDCSDPPEVHVEWITDDHGARKSRSYILTCDEKLYLDIPQNRPKLSDRAVHIEDILSGLAAAIGGDHTTDVSRLLRVPGTWRRKDARNGAEPLLCTIADLDPQRLYDLVDFERFAERSPARQRRLKVAGVKLPRVRKQLSAGVENKLNSHILASSLEADDRSTSDFSLCCFAIRRGIDPEYLWGQVADVSKFQARGREYFDLTWQAACAAVREDTFDKAAENARQKAAATARGDDVEVGSDGLIAGLGEQFKALGVPRVLADVLLATESFASAEGGQLFHYSGGAYRGKADDFVRRRVVKILKQNRATSFWSDRLSSEVAKFIAACTPELWECPPMDRINLKNGILRIADRQLLAHTPDWLSDIQLPVAFDPAATCPNTDRFDAQVFPADCLELSHEIVAWLMLPNTSIQKAVLLIGEGGNGKSRKLAQIQAFLGSRNVRSMSLHQIEGNKFSRAHLRGKLANICPDLPSADLAGTSVFKALLGGDTIEAEHKFCESFVFLPFARLIFSANHAPKSNDSSAGFFDRWLVIPFEGRFRGTSTEILSQDLDAMLQQPDELSGLLNHALSVIDRVQQRGLSEPESIRLANEEFRSATDPLSVWLNSYTVDDQSGFVVCDSLSAAYAADCERRGRPTVTSRMFGRMLRRLRPNTTRAMRSVNGDMRWTYLGIDMLHDAGANSVEIEAGDEDF
jgi:putative DNA primase/helicase